jgi:hypothetical protein
LARWAGNGFRNWEFSVFKTFTFHRLGSRYFGFNLARFYWECLKLVAASEELTETDILRRIIRSWSETLPPAVQEKARAETIWKVGKPRYYVPNRMPDSRLDRPGQVQVDGFSPIDLRWKCDKVALLIEHTPGSSGGSTKAASFFFTYATRGL